MVRRVSRPAVLRPRVLLSAGPPSSTSTWSPTDKTGNFSLSGGNLIATGVGTNNPAAERIRANAGSTSGQKSYWEYELTTLPAAFAGAIYFCFFLGLSDQALALLASPYWSIQGDGTVLTAGGTAGGGSIGALAQGNVLGWCYDHDAKELYLHKNGTFPGTTDPVARINPHMIFTTLDNYFPTLQIDNRANTETFVTTLNVGSVAFNYSPPTGYSAL